MAVKFNSSGGGSVLLDAPSTASNLTVTLPSASGTLVSTGSPFSGGTANGVVYLNGSSVPTTGSALTFDGASLGVGTSSPSALLHVYSNSTYGRELIQSGASALYAPRLEITDSRTGGGTSYQLVSGGSLGAFTLGDLTNSQTAYNYFGGASGYHNWYQNNSEQMRLTSTGLGIGVAGASTKLQVIGTSGALIDAAGSAVAGLQNLLSLRTGSGNSYGFQIKGNYTTEDYLIQNYYGGYLAFGTNDTERMRIDSSGNLLYGTTSSAVYGKVTLNVGTSPLVMGTFSTSIMQYTKLQNSVPAASTTVDAFNFTNNSGNTIGSGMVCGTFYVACENYNTGSAYIATYNVVSAGNGTLSATLTNVNSVSRGTNPVTSVQLANDGGSGSVKLTITYTSGASNAFTTTVVFFGQVY